MVRAGSGRRHVSDCYALNALSNNFIEHCLDNPQKKALAAFKTLDQ
jgi:hypothetical protein